MIIKNTKKYIKEYYLVLNEIIFHMHMGDPRYRSVTIDRLDISL